MSLLRSDRLVIGIAPERLGVGLVRGRFKRVLVEAKELEWSGLEKSPAACAAALDTWLTKQRLGRMSVAMVLSNAFVRFALIPWSAQAMTADERAVLAMARFAELYGDMLGWTVQGSPQVYGQSQVCCAIETAWLDALKPLFRKHRLQVRSLQPAFTAGWNRWRDTAPRTAFVFAMLDHGVLTQGVLAAEVDGQGWRSLRSSRLPQEPEALVEALSREAAVQHLVTGMPKMVISLHGTTGMVDSPDWRLTDATHHRRYSPALALALAGTPL